MSNKHSASRATADTALAAVEKARQRPEIAAAMRADSTLASKMQAAARDAAAAETQRCAQVVALCDKLGQPKQALAAINSGKSPAELEPELRQTAIAAGWDRAIGAQQAAQGAPGADWDAAVARANGQ